MTPDQLAYWVQATGWTPDEVIAWATYYQQPAPCGM